MPRRKPGEDRLEIDGTRQRNVSSVRMRYNPAILKRDTLRNQRHFEGLEPVEAIHMTITTKHEDALTEARRSPV